MHQTRGAQFGPKLFSHYSTYFEALTATGAESIYTMPAAMRTEEEEKAKI
jgi:hypothetical protein